MRSGTSYALPHDVLTDHTHNILNHDCFWLETADRIAGTANVVECSGGGCCGRDLLRESHTIAPQSLDEQVLLANEIDVVAHATA